MCECKHIQRQELLMSLFVSVLSQPCCLETEFLWNPKLAISDGLAGQGALASHLTLLITVGLQSKWYQTHIMLGLLVMQGVVEAFSRCNGTDQRCTESWGDRAVGKSTCPASMRT